MTGTIISSRWDLDGPDLAGGLRPRQMEARQRPVPALAGTLDPLSALLLPLLGWLWEAGPWLYFRDTAVPPPTAWHVSRAGWLI